MTQKDPLAEKALDAVKQRYSPPPDDSVQGVDFREQKKEEGWTFQIDEELEDQIDNEILRMTNPPQDSKHQFARIALWKRSVTTCMKYLALLCPKTEERAIAISRLRECMMWGEAAIRCNPDIDADQKEDDASASSGG